MEENIHRRLVGQKEAVVAVADAIRRNRAGIARRGRPIGSFLFLGPTGVGKTELAKALAEFMFDDENRLVRVDMSEFQERHEASKLIGAPPGYVGYGEGGQLTERVRRHPYSVVLFDELEKAHPDVFNLLLQILDEGRLTDGQGRSVNFQNCVIIGTSNLGSAQLVGARKTLGFGQDDDARAYERTRRLVTDEVKRFFRPELLNRIDDIIVFHPLERSDLLEIAGLALADLRSRLAERDIDLTIADAVRARIAKDGYDPVYGARPLRREIARQLENPLALRMVKGELREGDSARVDLDAEGEIAITVQRRPGGHLSRTAAASATARA
ncbi:AAA family ATPase [Myxococcota bacterium]|nr:AAA family ATPase [Myxococcota bacterium]